MSEWFWIYVAGCAVAVFLWICETSFFYGLDWILKGGVFRKNLKKITEVDTEGFWAKFWGTAVLLIFSWALSWVQVLLSICSILWRLGKVLRELFVTVPEEVKQLRFPLYNNADMSSEAVWAYVQALQVKAGGHLATAPELLRTLQAVRDNHKQFASELALKHLKALNAVSAEAIDDALKTAEAARGRPDLRLCF